MFSTSFKLTLIWIIGGTVAYMLAYYHIEAVLIDKQFVPYGPDSFYHARRILFLLNTGTLLQFDPHVNAPHGDLISWPWGFDTLMASIVYTAKQFSNSSALSILVKLPPLWVYINTALIIAIAKSLRLSLSYTILAVACFSLSPLTQQLHFIGRIDHHFVEYSFVLGNLLLGILWFQNPGSWKYALGFGILLGVSQAFHNGLFILQLPLLLTMLILWAQEIKYTNTIKLFIAGLILSTFVTLLPSETFRLKYFSFYYHSWFHFYIACSTSLVIIFFNYVKKSILNIIFLFFLCITLSFPVANDVIGGVGFIVGDLPSYGMVGEFKSPVFDEFKTPISWDHDSPLFISGNIRGYTGLLFLLPISIIILFLWTLYKKENYKLYIFISSLFGVILLLSQYRLNYFGSYVLYFPLLIVSSAITNGITKYKYHLLAGNLVLLTICYYPSINYLSWERPVGGSYDYALTYPVYSRLKTNCENEPGVVLAGHNDGHYITFHTDCSVIANNMVISPLDINRVRETERLFSLSSDEIINSEKWIDYIYVRREDNIYKNYNMDEVKRLNKGLRKELLFNDNVNSKLVLISEIIFDYNNQETPIAKIFKIQR